MIARLSTLLTTVMLLATEALGQADGVYAAPTPKRRADESSLIEWGIGVVFLIGCLVIAFKPSKRSNIQ